MEREERDLAGGRGAGTWIEQHTNLSKPCYSKHSHPSTSTYQAISQLHSNLDGAIILVVVGVAPRQHSTAEPSLPCSRFSELLQHARGFKFCWHHYSVPVQHSISEAPLDSAPGAARTMGEEEKG